jgi:pimeloyl-ACP methyl ester carboxylesterase
MATRSARGRRRSPPAGGAPPRAPRRIPTVLLPGFDGSGRLYGPLLRAGSDALALRTVSYPPDRALDLAALTALARAALPDGGAPWLLAAESFSGPIAVRLAAERPPGLCGLVLAATYLRRPLGPALAAVWAVAGARLLRLGLPPLAARVLMAGLDAPDAVVEEACAAVAALAPDVAARRAVDALTVDVRADLARVAVPVLYLAPGRDRLLHGGGAGDVLAACPEAEVVRLDTPHMVFQRAPHACLLAMEGFARRAVASPARPASA